MRKSLLAASTVLALLAPAAAYAIDPFFPTFGNDGYDVSLYDIDLDATVNPNRIEGTALIVLETETDLAELAFDLEALNVASVTINGNPVTFTHPEGKLVLFPSKTIPAGRTLRVKVTYAGKPIPLDDPTLEEPDPCCELGWINYKKQSAYALSEPVGTSNWFPVNDEPTDKASYRIRLTVPKPLTAVANGNLTKVEDLGTAQRFTWSQVQPMASYLATANINTFTMTTQQTADGKPLRYFTTAKSKPADITVLQKTPEMISFFESLVGPYPFDAYGSVLVDDPKLYYALETQAMSTFPQGAIREDIVAHELAHQWFGNSVTVAQWADLWLAEGFATYFEILWPNHDDPAGFTADMQGLYAYVVEEGVGPAVVSRPQDIFADNTYYRGALTLYALQLEVGDKMFRKIIRAYYDTYAGGNATSAGFIAVAESVSKDPDVGPLLNAWLYEEPVPPLPGASVASAKVAAKLPASAAFMRRAHPLLGALAK